MPHKITNTGKPLFDDGVTDSHATMQGAVAAATTQASANTAMLAHFDRCIALAVANGVSPAIYIEGRRNVGTRA